MAQTQQQTPKAFLSYSWDDPEHRTWILKLAERLRADGVDITLDQWHAAPGDQLPLFMERAVRQNDYVLVVCTPRYKQRSDDRSGGVAYEGDIITAEVLTTRNHRKFIPILRRGKWEDAAASWLLGKYYIDLRGNPYSEVAYHDLLATLHNARPIAPPIGQFLGAAQEARSSAEPSEQKPAQTAYESYMEQMLPPWDKRDSKGLAGTWRTTLTADFRTNLPSLLSSFVGREREMDLVRKALERSRLVTLTGTPGTGKTRLALEVAAQLVDKYPDGVWQVGLAALTSGELVSQAVASALGIREEPNHSLRTTLTTALRPRHLLLLLDNCEHLIEDCALLFDALLRNCPELHVLATSREPLGIAGETILPVPPLPLPDRLHPPPLEELIQNAAVRLFADRATAVVPGFGVTPENAEYISQICRRLDGIPLAIELAAARVTTLSPRMIADRLSNAFVLLTGGSRIALPKDQTLMGTINWSYNLLLLPKQVMWRRLSVFAGGWTLEAVEAVCVGEDIAKHEVLDLLTQLVDKSMVVVEERTDGTRRYRLIEILRQYAQQKLVESGESQAVRSRHAEYYLGFAEKAHPELRGPDQVVWLGRLEDEHDNLRAALEWWLEHGAAEQGLRLSGALGRFWHMRGYWSEGKQRLIGILSIPGGLERTEFRARALTALGHLHFVRGDYAAARSPYEESLEIRRELGSEAAIADSLHRVGILAEVRGDYALSHELQSESLNLAQKQRNRVLVADILHHLGVLAAMQSKYGLARELHEQSLTIRREVGDRWGIAWSLIVLGNVLRYQGDYNGARIPYEESLGIYRELGDRRRIAFSLNNLGLLDLGKANYEAARASFNESLTIARELGDRKGVAEALMNLGSVAQEQGKLAKARVLHEESLTIGHEIGNRSSVADALQNLGLVYIEEGEYARADEHLRESLEIRRELGEKWRIAESLEGFAKLAIARSEVERALMLAGAASTLRRSIGVPLTPAARIKTDHELDRVRQALSEDAATKAWRDGQTMTLEQVLVYALAGVEPS